MIFFCEEAEEAERMKDLGLFFLISWWWLLFGVFVLVVCFVSAGSAQSDCGVEGECMNR